MPLFGKATKPRRNVVRRLVAGLVVLTTIYVGLVSTSSAKPASASPASCSPTSNNGFIQIPYNKVGSPADFEGNPVVLYGSPRDGVLVRLETGTLPVGSVTDEGVWARLYNTGPPLVSQDQVWLDFAEGPGHNSYLRCGPFQADGKQMMTTPAKGGLGAWDEFRACAKLLGMEPMCTDWWEVP